MLLLALCLCAVPPLHAQTYWNGTAVKDWTGTGTESDPILISTPEQLAGLADSVNRHADFEGKYIELTADIWLTDFTADSASWLSWKPIGAFSTVPEIVVIGQGCTMDTCYFRGHFNGNGHTIYNLFTAEAFDNDGNYDPDADNITLDYRSFHKGLFGFNAGTISNLHIANADWSGDGSTGILVANNTQTGSITHCSVQGRMLGRGVSGGLVGTNEGLIDSCSVEIEGNNLVGGLVGNNAATGIIQYCNAVGTLQGTYGAGITGTNAGLIAFTHSRVNITKGGLDKSYLSADTGGFVNSNGESGVIKCSTASGNITVGWFRQAGAFCGANRGRIESCYATGNVMGYADRQNTLAQFVVSNGRAIFMLGSYSVLETGTCINCFATGKCLLINSETESTMTNAGFAAAAARVSYGEADSFYCSKTVNCYFNTEAVPDKVSNTYGARSASIARMQTKAFVDTLNMVAAWMGTSQWEYRSGQLPVPTGEIATENPYVGGGNGTKDNPYLVSTKQHLEALSLLCNRGWPFEGEYIRQTEDIALNAPMEQWGEQAPTQWHPIGESYRDPKMSSPYNYVFVGHYDGDFHKVENMYIDGAGKDYLGFFGILHWGSSVCNLSVENVWMYGENRMGILVGSLGEDNSETGEHITISQCFTSGRLENTKPESNVGALVGSFYGRNKHILNCGSTAELVTVTNSRLGGGTGAVQGYPFHIAWDNNDTLVNYLYAGTVSGSFRSPELGFGYYENAWFDKSFIPATHNVAYSTSLPTAELQSKEMVNRYNVSVDRWNAAHDLQLDYWQYRPGDYPRPVRGVVLPHTVRFDARGGTLTDRVEMHVLDSSRIDYPATPVREGWLFAGWYADPDYKHVCVADTMLIVSDTTLYARWLPDEANDYDIAPFENRFATTFHIKTKAQLRGLSVYVNGLTVNYETVVAPHDMEGKTVVLDKDIFLNDTTDWHLRGGHTFAEQWSPIGMKDTPFKGVFDGQGHTVYGLYCKRTANSESYLECVGLFGYVEAGEIKNVHIRNAYVEAPSKYLGLLVAESCSEVSGCTAQGILHAKSGGTRTGGLIGRQCKKVTRCGWEGYMYYSKHDIVYADFDGMMGGLICEFDKFEYQADTIRECYTKGIINGAYAAGLVKECRGVIKDCYSLADVTAQGEYAYGDGLCHYIPEGSIVNSYCANTVTINNVIYDGAALGALTNVYYLSHDAPRTNGRYGTPLTNLQMHAKTSFKDYDFDTTWGRKDTINGGYPYLRWQYGDYITDDPDAEYVAVTGITLDVTTKEILTNDTCRLTATIQPDNATNRKVLWKSSDERVATVDTAGLVTALSAGQTTIMAKTQEGLKTARCTLTVVQPVLGIKWYSDIITLGKTQQMKAVFTPDSLTRPVQWNSSNPEVASIDSSGLVTALSVGNTYISVQTLDGSLASEEKKIYVVWYPVTGVTLSGVSTIAVGQSAALSISITPYNASNRNVTWASSDERILSVSNGRITGVSPGTATVTVTTEDGGFTAQKEITVTGISVTGVSISGVSKVGVGEIVTLTALVSPTNASNRHVTWTSSDETILTVDDDGNLTGVALGTATVTVTTDDGGYTASQEIEVIRVAVTGVRLNGVPTLRVGEKYQMEAAIQPANATDKRLLWSSDNESVLRVDSTGMLTALTESRRVTVTVTTVEGGYTASRTIRVSGFMYTLTDFAIAPADTVLSQGDTLTLTALVTPAEATEFTAFTWQSSDSEVVSVDNGVARALATGEAIVTATATFAGMTLEATCRITCHPATALHTPADGSAPARKVLIDNVLYIVLPDGHMYDMMGQKVK